jgi:hypothetical protein
MSMNEVDDEERAASFACQFDTRDGGASDSGLPYLSYAGSAAESTEEDMPSGHHMEHLPPKNVNKMVKAGDWKGIKARLDVDDRLSLPATILHKLIRDDRNNKLRAELVLRILELDPAKARVKNHIGCLPLHIALERCIRLAPRERESVVLKLVEVFPEALTDRGGHWKHTPIHNYMEGTVLFVYYTKQSNARSRRLFSRLLCFAFADYASFPFSFEILRRGQLACCIPDGTGYLPLHVACECRTFVSTRTLRVLVAANPLALFAETKDKQTCLSLAQRRYSKTKVKVHGLLIDELMEMIEDTPLGFSVELASETTKNYVSSLIRQGIDKRRGMTISQFRDD